MSRVNNTTKTKSISSLNKRWQSKIQSPIEQKDENDKRLFSNTYIANYIGVNKSTISRELNKRKSYKFIVRSGKSVPKPYNAVDALNAYIFKISSY